MPVAWDRLAWLHDCELRHVEFLDRGDGTRTLAVTMGCPSDLGLPEWDGRTLILRAVGLWFFRYDGFCTLGPDTIDSVGQGLWRSEATVAAALATNRRSSLVSFSVAFSSGMSLEVVCDDVEVGVSG